ncbi:MAG: hypothetical protein ACLQVD_14815 [Capsulimonadaceae bacterium]
MMFSGQPGFIRERHGSATRRSFFGPKDRRGFAYTLPLAYWSPLTQLRAGGYAPTVADVVSMASRSAVESAA